jgi:two-component system chemotaxis sensor kinase CheA
LSRLSDDRMAELRELFFESAQELLQGLNDETLRLEKHPEDGEPPRAVRRIVHTLKGDAAACGYREFSELAHEFEDILAMAGSAAQRAEIVEAALTAADVFGTMLEAYRRKRKPPSAEPLRKMLRKLKDAKPGKKAVAAKRVARKPAGKLAAQPFSWTEYERLAIDQARGRGRQVHHVTLRMDPKCAMPEAALQMVRNALSTIGEVLALHPQDVRSLAAMGCMEAALASEQPVPVITAKCKIPAVVLKVALETFPTVAPGAGAADPGGTAVESSDESTPGHSEASRSALKAIGENTLRVEAERIDSVLNLVGELIVGKSMLGQALGEFGKRFPKDPLRAKFADALAFQGRVLNDLQRCVMKIRMVPVEQLFRRFPRMVRDVSKQCGKEVELVVSGQDTDLDKSLLDALAEPLTHIVRNAISHGLESPEERRRLGKPGQGRIKLDAYHQGGQVVIEVADDGRGMDVEQIRAKAVEQGLASAQEAARLSDAEVMEFIFHPGFSTAEQVTEISGRGVGMDVVQNVLHRLKGTVTTETRPGKGTTFCLKLPLTLAIIKAVLFRVEHRLYAVPLNSVVEMTRAHEADVHRVDNHEVLQLRTLVLPLVRLGRPTLEANNRSQRFFVLVVALGEHKLGLVVDGLVGEEELVIKALDSHIVSSELISGASILGDGRVVLILNLAAVQERVSRSRPEDPGAVAYGLLLPVEERKQMRSRTTGSGAGEAQA